MSGKAERSDEIQEQIQDLRVAQRMTSILDLDTRSCRMLPLRLHPLGRIAQG